MPVEYTEDSIKLKKKSILQSIKSKVYELSNYAFLGFVLAVFARGNGDLYNLFLWMTIYLVYFSVLRAGFPNLTKWNDDIVFEKGKIMYYNPKLRVIDEIDSTQLTRIQSISDPIDQAEIIIYYQMGDKVERFITLPINIFLYREASQRELYNELIFFFTKYYSKSVENISK